MDGHDDLDAVLAAERAAGRLTRDEAKTLQRHLDTLAFNITLSEAHGPIPQRVAAHWMFFTQGARTDARRELSARRKAMAERSWRHAIDARLLRVSQRGVAFVDETTRLRFCLHFSRGLELASAPRLVARPGFAPVWQNWAHQDHDLALRLIALLDVGRQPRIRVWAAKVLGYLQDPRASEALTAALSDPSDAVRIAVTGALAAYGEAELIHEIANDIPDASPCLRPALCAALGGAGEPAVDTLLGLLERPDWVVRSAAIMGLGKTGSARAAQALLQLIPSTQARRDSVTARHITDALAAIGEHAIPIVIDAYRSGDPAISKTAREALGRLGYANVAADLLDLLRAERHRSPNGRFPELCVALAHQCAFENADLFAALATDLDDEIRRSAAIGLARIGDPRALEPLLYFLRRHDGRSRVDLVEALGLLGDRRAVEPLIEALGDDTVGKAAREAAEGVFDHLGERFKDLGPQFATERGQMADSYERVAIAKALSKLRDPRAIRPLAAMLPSRVWFEAIAFADALIALHATDAVEPLLSVLRERGAETPAGVLRALGRLGGRRAADELLPLLDDPDLHRLSAPASSYETEFGAIASALGDLRDRRAVEPILRIVQRMRAGVAGSTEHAAWSALQQGGGMYSIVRALGNLGDPRAIETLLSFISPRSPLDKCAIDALIQIVDERALDGLRALQRQHEPTSELGVWLARGVRELSARLERRNRHRA